MDLRVYTVGHSNHGIEKFLAMLSSNGITAIADVRSSPFSRFNPQFNREELKRSLTAKTIRYVFLGAELGARSDDPSCYVNGKVQYDRLAESPAFRFGVSRVLEGAKSHHIALMCAEKDPIDCHRTILVARDLSERGVEVIHILADGSTESHDQSMDRLLDSLGISTHDMFRTREQILEDAYRQQGSRIAYDRTGHQSADEDDGLGGEL